MLFNVFIVGIMVHKFKKTALLDLSASAELA